LLCLPVDAAPASEKTKTRMLWENGPLLPQIYLLPVCGCVAGSSRSRVAFSSVISVTCCNFVWSSASVLIHRQKSPIFLSLLHYLGLHNRT